MTRAATTRATGLRVSVTDGRGRPIGVGAGARLAAWLRRAAPRGTRGWVAVAIVPDRTIRELNRRHRGVDRPTDVLSFPVEPVRSGKSRARIRTRVAGDLAIAKGVATRQAKAAGHALGVELRILALHGMLHLLGYDHEVDKGEMERMEERLRRRAGLPAGLIVRVSGSDRPRHA